MRINWQGGNFFHTIEFGPINLKRRAYLWRRVQARRHHHVLLVFSENGL